MKSLATLTLAIVVCLTAGAANALSISDSELGSLSWTYSSDSTSDTAGSNTFKTYGAGYSISGGFLYVVIQTNFPEAGSMASDSYTNSTHLSTGDLYLNVGGTFQSGGGTVYGLATTSHANVVQQAYAGQSWTPVSSGSLYKNASFATGTYEQYQQAYAATPDDGDGNNRKNSYPTLITAGSLVAGDVSGVRYRANGASNPWDWDIFYKVSLSALGLTGGETLQSFWAMECGNDGVQQMINNPAVPEPTTIALMAAGISALAVRRRTFA
jgi:hypothetical protein